MRSPIPGSSMLAFLVAAKRRQYDASVCSDRQPFTHGESGTPRQFRKIKTFTSPT